MSLPLVANPEFTTTLFSTGEEIKYRPFVMKEEKILFMALEGGDNKEIQMACENVLNACILTPGVDIRNLPSFDIEMLFLKLRKKSVGEIVETSFEHTCGEVVKVKIDIDKVYIVEDKNHSDIIVVDDENSIGIKLKYPTLGTIVAMQNSQDRMETINAIHECTVNIFDKNNVYEQFTFEELKEWLEALPKSKFEKICSFFDTMPKVSYEFSFQCPKCGKSETKKIEGFENFFT